MNDQKETKPHETHKIKLNKQRQTFPFLPPINLVEEGKRLLGVTSFEAINCVFNITNENNSFSITTPGTWNSKSAQKTFDELIKVSELRFENDIKC